MVTYYVRTNPDQVNFPYVALREKGLAWIFAEWDVEDGAWSKPKVIEKVMFYEFLKTGVWLALRDRPEEIPPCL